MMLSTLSNTLAIAAIASFAYKVYADSRLSDPDLSGNLMIIFSRYFSIRHLFPAPTRNQNPLPEKLARKANKALRLFYLCFAGAIVTGFLNAIT